MWGLQKYLSTDTTTLSVDIQYITERKRGYAIIVYSLDYLDKNIEQKGDEINYDENEKSAIEYRKPKRNGIGKSQHNATMSV